MIPTESKVLSTSNNPTYYDCAFATHLTQTENNILAIESSFLIKKMEERVIL
jgi:hypothetical protein